MSDWIPEHGKEDKKPDDEQNSANRVELDPPECDPTTCPKTEPATPTVLDFPIQAWNTLNSCLNMIKWVVPVLPNSQLETLIKSAIELAKHGKDLRFPSCVDFYRFGLLSSFRKTFHDEAVAEWDCQILHYIYMNALLAIELCAVKSADDCLPILELERILFDPDSRFQQHSVQPKNLCWSIQHGEKTNGVIRYTHILPLLPHLLAKSPNEDLNLTTQADSVVSKLKEFANPKPSRRPAPILTDFINLFGRLGGFEHLRKRFTRTTQSDDMPIGLIMNYLAPFSMCCDYLQPNVIEEYFSPIIDSVIPHILHLTDEDSKKEAKLDIKTESVTELSILLRCFLTRIPEKQHLLEQIDTCCLNLILRYLQFTSISKRMTALNDLNNLFVRLTPGDTTSVVDSTIRDSLTVDKVANWMREKQVISLMLRENLHQLQFVEKVERIIRFMIKHKHLTTADLDRIWEAQDGKHEAIARNVFDMLAKLAFEFTPEQLDHLLHRFQQSWAHATKRQREHLIDLICRLAEEDREGLMAQKVLTLLWDLAVSPDTPMDITDSALKAHAKILYHNVSEVGWINRTEWIKKLIEMLSRGPREEYLVPAIKQFIEICDLIPVKQYSSQPPYGLCNPRMRDIQELDNKHQLLEVAVNNVAECMAVIREQRACLECKDAKLEPPRTRPISLHVEVKELLEFIRYLLSEGAFHFRLEWMQKVWSSLMLDVDETQSHSLVFVEDRELCFHWFSLLPVDTIHSQDLACFFEKQVLRVDPVHMTPSGMLLFQVIFYRVNLDCGFLIDCPTVTSTSLNSGTDQFHVLMDHAELRGLDHLWRLLLDAPDAVASQAMQLLEHLYSNLTTRLIPRQAELHEDLVLHCLTRLRADFDTIRLLLNSGTDLSSADLCRTIERVARVIQLLRHCLRMGENATEKCVRVAQKLPLKRAWMGSSIVFTVTFGLPPTDSHGHLDSSSLPPSPIPSADVLGNASVDNQAPNTILFVAHANMTVGELRSQLLSFRLRALRARSISSDLPVTDLQHYNLDLYVNHSERQQTNSPGLFFSLSNNLSNCLLDPAADSQLVFSLLPLFDHWPTGFLVDCHHQAGTGSEPPTLKLTANVVLASSKFSYDFNKHTLLMTADTSKSPVSTVSSANTMISRAEYPSTVSTTVEQCYAEPPPDVQLLLSTATESAGGSSTKEGELDLTSPERRSNFLLQVAKLAMELNNSSLFSSVLDVLLCMPAPSSLIERLRLDIATSAQISALDTSKCLLSDWVTVPTPNRAALKGTHLEQLITASVHVTRTSCSPDRLGQLVELYYTLQVLYSLCLPASAISQCHDTCVPGNSDVHAQLVSGDLIKVMPWHKASQFTLQLLRAGAIPLLLSCPLLSETREECASHLPNSVQSTVIRLIRLWLTRLLRLLFTVCAFTLCRIVPITPSPDVSAHSEPSLTRLVQRVFPLCESLKTMVYSNHPVSGGICFSLKHADWVSRMAIGQRITAAEIQTQWLPDQDDCGAVATLVDLIYRSANDLTIEEQTLPNAVHGTSPGVFVATQPSTASLEERFSSLSKPSDKTESPLSGSQGHERTGMSTVNKQICQAVQNGDSGGLIVIESLACLPFCVALFPHAKRHRRLCSSSVGDPEPQTIEPEPEDWWTRLIHVLLFSPFELLRHAALHYLFQIVRLCSLDFTGEAATEDEAVHLVRLLFTFLPDFVPQHVFYADQYFRFLALLLRHVHARWIPFEEATSLLIQEAQWVRNGIAQRKHQQSSHLISPGSHLLSSDHAASSSPNVDSTVSDTTLVLPDLLLSGHMQICSALSYFPGPHPAVSPLASQDVNVSPLLAGNTEFEQTHLAPLTRDLIQSLLFPANKHDESNPLLYHNGPLPNHLLASVFDLLLSLARRDPSAVHRISQLLCQSGFPDNFQLSTYAWDYSPPALCNTASGASHFVGLRNGGATCYMNAILQQLFALIPIRNTVLSARPELRLAQDSSIVGETSSTESGVSSTTTPATATEQSESPVNTSSLDTPTSSQSETSKPLTAEQAHQLRLLLHLQSIFGHLTHSLVQSYRPAEFWQEFKFCSDQVKLNEQHDALEFLQTLGNDVDESLHLCGMPKAVEQVLGGTFADQKLCIDCPHRYSRNESFTTLNVDIRNHQNLIQSLEQYVKGDRLEGDNAYWCEACDKKVTTLKRMCIDRLPLVLAIQLKRFDYDWDRGVAIKFNGYFEFPRELDMYPYTVRGLSDRVHADDSVAEPSDELSGGTNSQEDHDTTNPHGCTRYTLRGVVVHSGQASGGHYYSFIRQFCSQTRTYKWYKYDDSDVSLSQMDNEDEARSAWFGGDSTNDPGKSLLYSGNGKRWWNAYILFYEREDFQSHVSRACSSKEFVITPRLQKLVNLENVDYIYQQMQFHPLLANFVINITRVSLDMCMRKPAIIAEDLCLTTLKLVVNFCFAVRFQPVARDCILWIPLFLKLTARSQLVREKFIQWTLLSSPDRVCELLFECPYPEVRLLFAILIVSIACARQSTSCLSSLDCLKAFCEARDLYFNNLFPEKLRSTDSSVIARAESAREVLGSLICSSNQHLPDGSICRLPSLTDILLRLLLVQLYASPAEFLRRDFHADGRAPGSLNPLSETIHHTASKNVACGSSYSRGYREVYNHPLIWNSFFAIFLDYAHSGEEARRILIRLGFLETIISYALKNPGAFTSSNSSFYSSNIKLIGSRSPESLKTSLLKILGTQSSNNISPSGNDGNSPFPSMTASVDSFVLVHQAARNFSSSSYIYGSTETNNLALTVQRAGTSNLWALLSLLIRSLDVSAHCHGRPQLNRSSTSPPPPPPPREQSETSPSSHGSPGATGDETKPKPEPSRGANPYAASVQPVSVISKPLANLLFYTSSNRFISCFIRPWFNVTTVDHIANTLMFLAFENADFSSVALDALVWLFQTSREDSDLTLSLIQSLLSVQDSLKTARLRYTMFEADQSGLAFGPPLNHHAFPQYTQMIKMFMELILNDTDIQHLFQMEGNLIDWLRRWFEAIAESMQTSSSISQTHWYSPGMRSSQAQDAFMIMVRRVYEVLPMLDDDQGGSSVDSEGLEYEDGDACPSSGSHYEDPMDQLVDGFERSCPYPWYYDPEHHQKPSGQPDTPPAVLRISAPDSSSRGPTNTSSPTTNRPVQTPSQPPSDNSPQ